MEQVTYDHSGRNLTHWGARLGCAGKLMGTKVSDGRRIKPDAPAESQPSLRSSCEIFLGALDYLNERDIRFFRVPSTFCPYATHPKHPEYHYEEQLSDATDMMAAVAERREEYGIELSFHPSQYVLLSSPREDLTATSIAELVWQIDLLNRWGSNRSMRVFLHGGGVYGERELTHERIIKHINMLPTAVRERFALENDEYSWNVEQLLPICQATGVPLVVDLHHHALNPGSLSWQEAMALAQPTWGPLQPKIHLSSPRDPDGQSVAQLRSHHDYIQPDMARSVFAYCDDHDWQPWVMLEAKHKDQAVLELRKHLSA